MRFLGGGKKRRESLFRRLARICLSLVSFTVFSFAVFLVAPIANITFLVFAGVALLCSVFVVLRFRYCARFCFVVCSQLICVLLCVVLLRRVFF